MQMDRCPACGWPTPQGRPCPRGCGASVPMPPKQPVYFQPTYAPPVQVQSAYAPSAAAGPGVAPVLDRRVSRRRTGPTGIGGFLILPVIGLILTVCWNGWAIYHDFLPFRESEAWAALTTPGSGIYHRLWQPLTLFELFATIVMIIAPMALLGLIFGKRRSARGFTVAFYVFCCVAVALDSGAYLLFMVHWLRSIGLGEAATTMSADALYGLYQVAALAAVWIPYFLLSRRVRNTFVNPVPAARTNPARSIASAGRNRSGNGRLRGALALLAVIALAGAGVYAFDAYLVPGVGAGAGAVVTSPTGDSQQLTQQADAALTAGDWTRAIELYTQAVEADPGYEPAYYGKWAALLQNNELVQALDVAVAATKQFADSRQAWFVLGYTQEARGDLESALFSYTRSLALPETAATDGADITEQTVRQRLDLVSYVLAITEPRVAIAASVNQVNAALQDTTPDASLLSSAADLVATALSTNIAELEKVTPPAYFASFHSGMLSAYGALESACGDLAAAVSSNSKKALAAARQSLDDAIDGFNRNDAIGTSLINDYYGQEPPIALRPTAAPGS